MDHIGIDLGSKDSQVCIRNAAGEIVGEWRWKTDRLIALLQDRPRARVIVETCTEAFRVAALAQSAGHDVRVVAATLVRSSSSSNCETSYARAATRIRILQLFWAASVERVHHSSDGVPNGIWPVEGRVPRPPSADCGLSRQRPSNARVTASWAQAEPTVSGRPFGAGCGQSRLQSVTGR
jgi:hypothetical protein